MIRVGIAFIIFMLMAGSVEVLADEESPTTTPLRGTVRLLEYRFEPARLTFNVGEPVELTLINDGTVLHEFVTEALYDLTVDVEINGVITEALGVAEFEIPPNGKAVLHFIPKKPGEFSFACRARKPTDHFEEGMTGSLLIQ
jgi:uncharacterized cupredoxin-like copper-binding protein